MNIIRRSDLDHLYKDTIRLVFKEGTTISPRGKRTIEIISPTLILEPQLELPVIRNAERKINHAFQIIEALQYLDGTMDVERICWYNRRFKDFLNKETNTFDGAYGPRLIGSIDWCYKLLISDPSTRQAIMPIFQKHDHRPSLDVPCTLSIQFLIRNNHLDMIVNMRSNDLDWGTPYDMMSFALIQHAMANWLSIFPGFYFHHVGSLHIYETSFDKLKKVLACDTMNEIKYGTFNLTKDDFHRHMSDFWKYEHDDRTRNVWFQFNEKFQPLHQFSKIITEYNHGRNVK